MACSREVDEVRPKPSCDQRTLTTPMPIRARLRIACTATCGSLAHAWTQRSPPEISGCSASPGNCGSSARAAGRRSARPNRSRPSASRNSVGPKPTVSVSRDGRQAERLAGVVRRRLRHPADRAEHPGVPARGHPGGGGGPLLEQLDQPGPVLGDHVEGHEVQPVLRRRDDAGLVLAVERHRPGRVVARRGRAVGAVQQRPRAGRHPGDPGHPGAGQGDRPAPGQPASAHRIDSFRHPVTSRRPRRPC